MAYTEFDWEYDRKRRREDEQTSSPYDEGPGGIYDTPRTAVGTREPKDLFGQLLDSENGFVSKQSKTLIPGGEDFLDAIKGEQVDTPEEQGIPDVEELRAEPWTTEFEQAALARADELVGERYNALRQQRQMTLARQGVGPDSPLYGRRMGELDVEQAKELSSFRRRLQIEKIDRRQRNLEKARGVEQQAENIEQQRLMLLLALMSGGPDVLGRLASAWGQASGQAGQEAGEAWGGLGDLLGTFFGGD